MLKLKYQGKNLLISDYENNEHEILWGNTHYYNVPEVYEIPKLNTRRGCVCSRYAIREYDIVDNRNGYILIYCKGYTWDTYHEFDKFILVNLI